MTSNCDRSKTIPVISKTTKNYHLRADEPPLRTEDEKPLPVYNCTLKVCPPRRLVSNFSCLSLKIVKLAFHWRWILPSLPADMLLHPDSALTALPEYIIIASDRQVVNYCTHTKILFFSFSGGAIARKMLS